MPRKIPRGPFKVLDAPSLQDDFYLNLVDWSSQNVLAVGLGSCVYLWSACTCKVTKLVDLSPNDMVCSVAWSQRGTYLSVGTTRGDTRIFDVSKLKQIRNMSGHRARVGTMAWNSHLLSTGSRDRIVLQRDVRAQDSFVQKCAPQVSSAHPAHYLLLPSFSCSTTAVVCLLVCAHGKLLRVLDYLIRHSLRMECRYVYGILTAFASHAGAQHTGPRCVASSGHQTIASLHQVATITNSASGL